MREHEKRKMGETRDENGDLTCFSLTLSKLSERGDAGAFSSAMQCSGRLGCGDGGGFGC